MVKEGSLIPKSGDETFFDWLSIEMVLVPEIENILCPICLDVPFVPRFTRCGHIYCLPCLLQYFQSNEPGSSPEGLGNNWRTCPVCSEPLHLKQLRPIKFCPVTEPKEGEIFHSILIKRPIGFINPIEPFLPNDSLSTISPFQKLIRISSSFLVNEIILPELSFLRSEVKRRKQGGEETLELSFNEASLKMIEDNLNMIVAKSKNDKLSDTVSTLGNKVIKVSNKLNTSCTPSTQNNTLSNVLSPPQSHPSNCYYYYQSRDGLNVFLHPLSMKILKYHFTSYELIPSHLSLPIIQLDRVIVNSSNRKRFKYLDHLSLGTQIILVEVDLKSIVSESTLNFYKKELSLRKGARDQNLKISTNQNKDKSSILEEWKRMEDDFYSFQSTTSAMDIHVPESVKLDNLNDDSSFPLPSSPYNTCPVVVPNKKIQMSSGSPSFSTLANSLNSPFTFSAHYCDFSSTNSPDSNSTTTTTSSTAASNGKKKILLFSNGLNHNKK